MNACAALARAPAQMVSSAARFRALPRPCACAPPLGVLGMWVTLLPSIRTHRWSLPLWPINPEKLDLMMRRAENTCGPHWIGTDAAATKPPKPRRQYSVETRCAVRAASRPPLWQSRPAPRGATFRRKKQWGCPRGSNVDHGLFAITRRLFMAKRSTLCLIHLAPPMNG